MTRLHRFKADAEVWHKRPRAVPRRARAERQKNTKPPIELSIHLFWLTDLLGPQSLTIDMPWDLDLKWVNAPYTR